jgi:hypothetical protein
LVFCFLLFFVVLGLNSASCICSTNVPQPLFVLVYFSGRVSCFGLWSFFLSLPLTLIIGALPGPALMSKFLSSVSFFQEFQGRNLVNFS